MGTILRFLKHKANKVVDTTTANTINNDEFVNEISTLNKGWLFTLSFLMGLCVDIFSDTPGVNSLAATLLAALKQPVYYAYVPKDDKTTSLIPSISTLGMSVYCKFLISMIGIYCILVFSIEYFNFADVKEIVIISASSCLLTFITLLAIDCLNITKS